MNECWSTAVTEKGMRRTDLCRVRTSELLSSTNIRALYSHFLLRQEVKPSELINEACDLLQLIFSFCKACAQLVTLEQTLKSRETFHVVKAEGVLKCSAWLICAACCRTKFQHAQFIKVRGGRFRNKSCCTLGSISVLLSTNLIPTVQMLLLPWQGPFLRVFCDYNWKSQ